MPMCLLLDEVDGADPHAQRKLVEWLASPTRKMPVLLTCNEIPRVFKGKPGVELVRCFPPKPADLIPLFPNHDVLALARQFKHDVRRMLQFLQYGESDVLPSVSHPIECSPEVLAILKHKMWFETCPIVQANALGTSSSHCRH